MTNKLTKLIQEEKLEITNPTTDGNEALFEQVQEELKDQDFDEGPITAIRYLKFNGKQFKASRSDPHGFWTVTLYGKGGSLPETLRGQYTSIEALTRDVQLYANK